ncbi:HpcH/HpaI aldolase/citrate lyase family protein [Aquipuribacter sp. MA13-6]|uniref:HpcH/HpaI aldolase/citrate lyase family protein n=1 Tax=unclassified Aquipuribacter TaxID=2635084 RepID=UPI003EE8D1B4
MPPEQSLSDTVPSSGASAGSRPQRARRSVLAVPGSSTRMLEKSKGLPVDAVLLDLEDAVADDAKATARQNVVAALREGGWQAATVTVRVNGWASAHTVVDVTAVLQGAGAAVDCLVLPKASDPGHVQALDLVLTQLERANGLPVGRIGLEVQVEDAAGLLHAPALASASPRVESLVLGPADLMADLGMRSLQPGEQPDGYTPGDAHHHTLMSILVAARAHGVHAVDGPYLQVRDVDGFRRQARRSAALGYDGKWVLHPDQVEACNEVFSPSPAAYERAEDVLDALAWFASPEGGGRGAAMLGEEMVDAASAAMARRVVAAGRAAGLGRPHPWRPPTPAGDVAEG